MYFTPERNERLARKLFKHVAETTTDRLDGFLEYDLSINSCVETAKRERTSNFESAPMMAAHSNQIPKPGSFITLQLNRSNVIVTRRSDGTVGRSEEHTSELQLLMRT